jgi:hypothetical protein
LNPFPGGGEGESKKMARSLPRGEGRVRLTVLARGGHVPGSAAGGSGWCLPGYGINAAAAAAAAALAWAVVERGSIKGAAATWSVSVTGYPGHEPRAAGGGRRAARVPEGTGRRR